MNTRSDNSNKLAFLLFCLAVVCVIIVASSGTRFVLATRGGSVHAIPLVWITPLLILGLIVPFWLRNLGGILSLLSAGLIAGGTLFSIFHTNADGNGFVVSWTQSLLCVIVTISAIIGVSQMDVDFTSVGLDDLLN